jgi:hypothetical protein
MDAYVAKKAAFQVSLIFKSESNSMTVLGRLSGAPQTKKLIEYRTIIISLVHLPDNGLVLKLGKSRNQKTRKQTESRITST